MVSLRGKRILGKALLDTVSDSSLIPEWVAQYLSLPKRPVHVQVSGVRDSSAGVARVAANLTVRSCHDRNFGLSVSAIVILKLTSKLPHRSVTLGN